jgi:hypothetical protein
MNTSKINVAIAVEVSWINPTSVVLNNPLYQLCDLATRWYGDEPEHQ